ncbi:MAG: metallophosphoesterase family protein [Candidatus Bathyarchaeia archaeon]
MAIISDVHSNLEAFREVMRWIDDAGIEEILNAGDIVGYGPSPNRCVSVVKEYGMKCVMGNHDAAALTDSPGGFNPYAAEAIHYTYRKLDDKSVRFLSSLPSSLTLDVEDARVCMFHGSPRDPINEYIFPSTPRDLLKHFLESTGADLLILGHTHVPMVVRFGKRVVLNPGGVGQPRDRDNRASLMLLRVDGDTIGVELKRIDYNIDKVAEKMIEENLPSFLAERLFHGV